MNRGREKKLPLGKRCYTSKWITQHDAVHSTSVSPLFFASTDFYNHGPCLCLVLSEKAPIPHENNMGDCYHSFVYNTPIILPNMELRKAGILHRMHGIGRHKLSLHAAEICFVHIKINQSTKKIKIYIKKCQ